MTHSPTSSNFRPVHPILGRDFFLLFFSNADTIEMKGKRGLKFATSDTYIQYGIDLLSEMTFPWWHPLLFVLPIYLYEISTDLDYYSARQIPSKKKGTLSMSNQKILAIFGAIKIKRNLLPRATSVACTANN